MSFIRVRFLEAQLRIGKILSRVGDADFDARLRAAIFVAILGWVVIGLPLMYLYAINDMFYLLGVGVAWSAVSASIVVVAQVGPRKWLSRCVHILYGALSLTCAVSFAFTGSGRGQDFGGGGPSDFSLISFIVASPCYIMFSFEDVNLGLYHALFSVFLIFLSSYVAVHVQSVRIALSPVVGQSRGWDNDATVLMTFLCASYSIFMLIFMASMYLGLYERERETKERVERKIAESVAASDAKSRFIRILSHEIRNPLTAVLINTESLLESDMEHTKRNLVVEIDSCSRIINSLLETVLDVAKIEANVLPVDNVEFTIESMLGTVMKSLVPLTRTMRIPLLVFVSLHEQHRSKLIGASKHISRVLRNLIENALKFTEHGHIMVTIQSEGDDVIRVEVEDTGVGIARSNRDLLFNSFTLLDSSTTREYSGFGLGLYLCARLCQKFGGKIDLSDEKTMHRRSSACIYRNLGSTFYFTFNVRQIQHLNDDELKIRPVVPSMGLDGDHSTRIFVFCLCADTCMALALEELLRQAAKLSGVTLRLSMSSDVDIEFDVDLQSMADGISDRVLLVDGSSVAAACTKKMDSENKVENPSVWSLPRAPGFTRRICLFAPQFVGGTEDYELIYEPISRELLSTMLFEGRFEAFPTVRLRSTSTPILRAATGLSVDPTVLVVDDSNVVRRVVARIVREFGLQVAEAANGRDALEMFGSFSKSLKCIFMDIEMPVMDGYTAAKRIRSIEDTNKHVSIVALSGNAMLDDQVAALDCGMCQFCPKPVTRDLLAEALSHFYFSCLTHQGKAKIE